MLLEFKDVSFEYKEPGNQITALSRINLNIDQGEAIGVIGPSGSGKSTLLLHCNGILKPQSGKVIYKGNDIHAKGYEIKLLRREVGFLFQFAEANLFGQTVFEDIAYGLYNHGFPQADIDSRVGWALQQAGLDSSFKERSPFTLSGGEKRKVALAGILATRPKVLIMDEPTVGLDPVSRRDLLKLVSKLNSEGTTTIIVSHDLAELAKVARRVIVVNNGQVEVDGPARQVLTNTQLQSWGLEIPEVVELGKRLDLKYQGQPVLTEKEAVEAILSGRWKPGV